MTATDLVLFAELLIYLSGTFVYGFIARHLLRDHSLLEGNLAARGLVVSVTAWYGGCLIDEVVGVLVDGRPLLATSLDLLRGVAWLLVFPLLVHAIWRFRRSSSGTMWGWSSWLWLVPGYTTLLLFLPAAAEYWRSEGVHLQNTAGEVFDRIVFHVVVTIALAVWLLMGLVRSNSDRRVRSFLGGLLITIVVVLIAAASGLLVLGPAARWAAQAAQWRAAAQLLGLAPAVVVVYFTQRHAVLGFSISLRSVRHFFVAIVVVVLVMLAGPAVQAEGSDAFRRIVAWGVLVALLGGTAYSALVATAARTSATMRRLIEPSVPTQELERLARRMRSLETPKAELLTVVGEELGTWLGARTQFVDSTASGQVFAGCFAATDGGYLERTTVPSALQGYFAKNDLWAAFPLRVAGELTHVLLVSASTAGSGAREGDRETVLLVLGQLGAVLELRHHADQQILRERQAAEHERLSTLGLVAASLAHEIKNPLASMKALAQTVREELQTTAPDGEQAEDLAVIVEQIDRLAEVTREILGFARPAAGEACDLAALVRNTIYVLQAEARRRGVTILGNLVMDVGAVAGTAAAWQSVVFNLILNSASYAPAGSEVNVELSSPRSGCFVFSTRNSGPAIVDEVATQVFEPFTGVGGTGLGLNIVRRRVAELGGTVALENEPENVRFVVEVGQP